MFHRPLIPIFTAFAGGVLFAHRFLPHNPFITIVSAIFICLLLTAVLFIPYRAANFLIIGVFFLAAIALYISRDTSTLLDDIADAHPKVTVQGTVLEPPRISQARGRFRLRTESVYSESGSKEVKAILLVKVYKDIPNLKPGDKIRLRGRLKPFKNFNNPGSYDYRSAMKLKGVSCALSVSDGRGIVPMGPGFLPFPYSAVERFQRPVRVLLKKGLSSQGFALYRALLLGERQGIDGNLREPFDRTGLGHILAVSGLHIGLVAWVSFFIVRALLSISYRLMLTIDIRKTAAAITCLPVIGYTVLAGFQISSQRAMIMVLVYLLSIILGKEKDVWSTLALAGLIILAVNPPALFDVSFQLSFCAVVGIVWLSPILFGWLKRPEKNLRDKVFEYLAGLAAVTVSATLFLLPVIAFYFNRVSVVGIPANITVVPILGLWVIPFGFMAALLLPVSGQLALLLINIGAAGLDIMIGIIRFFSSFSWSYMWLPKPNMLETLFFYCLIVLPFVLKKRWAGAAILAITLFWLSDVAYWIHDVHFRDSLKVTYLDVGQGNSALVEFPMGKKMLIDGGGFPGDTFDSGRMVIAPFLWRSKIMDVDYLVLSHPQTDHMNGLRFIAQNFSPTQFWCNGDRSYTDSFKELMGIIDKKGIDMLLPEHLRGTIDINGAEVRLLHPLSDKRLPFPYKSGRDLNNNSLVLRISYMGKTFLFPGDIQAEGERILVSRSGAALKSDFLLCPHHGSSTSCSVDFLEMVRPGQCIISCGRANPFGFPHEEVVERLKGYGCAVIRIDKSGAATVKVENGDIEIDTFLETGTAPPD